MTRSALTVAVSAVAVGGVLLLGSLVTVAEIGTGGQAATRAGAALRTAWGERDLTGVWQAAKLGARPGQDTFNLTQLERLYGPEGRAKMKQLSATDDPTLRCVPPAFPRAAMLGWPLQIIQSPGFVSVFSEAYHTYRIIPTDGRPHLSADFRYPVYLGDPVGHWEGDTLVVDLISFNGETWLAGGDDKPTPSSTGVWPTSDAMHVVERWRRADANTLEYQARVEDPKMLTGPWETPKVTLKRAPVERVEEVKCFVAPYRAPSGETIIPVVPPAAYLKQFGR